MLGFYFIFIPLVAHRGDAFTVDKISEKDKIETFAADCKEKLLDITQAVDTVCTAEVFAGLQDSVCHSKSCGFS